MDTGAQPNDEDRVDREDKMDVNVTASSRTSVLETGTDIPHQEDSSALLNRTEPNDEAVEESKNVSNSVNLATETSAKPSAEGVLGKSLKVNPSVKRNEPEVIDLLDDDDDEDGATGYAGQNSDLHSQEAAAKRHKTDQGDFKAAENPGAWKNNTDTSQGSQTVVNGPLSVIQRSRGPTTIVPGLSLFSGKPDALDRASQMLQELLPSSATSYASGSSVPLMRPPEPMNVLAQTVIEPISHAAPLDHPVYFALPSGFGPTWGKMLPTVVVPKLPTSHFNSEFKYYKLSLLNVTEFTITGLSPRWDAPPTPIHGLRLPIRKISRGHGKAVYEQDKESGVGKWRIPLGAYQAFVSFLVQDPRCRVEGIPADQLRIASLERARQEKGYPSAEKLTELGVPKRLAASLAPFQRGGVDFVTQKGGRALIADDMGLGKTIQGIASMSVYFDEWPLLVLCPSSARYHWESEFQRWLGDHQDGDGLKDGDTLMEQKESGSLLKDWQINVLTSSKERVLPFEDTKVVICSYGLAPTLIESEGISVGTFRCAIVDESHMLKNKTTKRTSSLSPILQATSRCVLLSGTPALARPAELWPQLEILGNTTKWWRSEGEFMRKYAKNCGPRERAELHAMLTGTVMIRRHKVDILKNLPRKSRKKAVLNVLSDSQRREFGSLLAELRQGKGALGKIAREQHAVQRKNTDFAENPQTPSASAIAAARSPGMEAALHEEVAQWRSSRQNEIMLDVSQKFLEGRARIQQDINASSSVISLDERHRLAEQLEGELRGALDQEYHQRLAHVESQTEQQVTLVRQRLEAEGAEAKRTTVLSRLYGLTGNVKLPVLVDMLRRWLKDPTKGKLCIFAHHISVLDDLRDLAGLSNEDGSRTKYIRIDGSTLPRQRQEQITAFQNDPSVRIAILGITAAGVAVTLTASSTVWFAELFWTPAIMIQAEDRCHRIGQQGRVECLYFVASGTLDEVLWRLIEKKFRDLGEFVEGKEKQKLVVDRTYKSIEDLHSAFEGEDGVSSNNDLGSSDESGLVEELCGDDLADDIAELGEEERRMLKQGEDDEEECPVSQLDRKPAAVDRGATPTVGQSEDQAIILSDDEEDSVPCASGTSQLGCAVNKQSGPELPVVCVPPSSTRIRCRYYQIRISGPRIGIGLLCFRQRLFISLVESERRDRLGHDCKPAVGDVIVGVNGKSLPPTSNIIDQTKLIRGHLNRAGSVDLILTEMADFLPEILSAIKSMAQKQGTEKEVVDLIQDD